MHLYIRGDTVESLGCSIAGERVGIAGVSRSGHCHCRSLRPFPPFLVQWPPCPGHPLHHRNPRPLSKSCSFNLKQQLLRGQIIARIKLTKVITTAITLNLECCSTSLTSRSGMGQVVEQELQSEIKFLDTLPSLAEPFVTNI